MRWITMINSVNNDVSFQSVKLYLISKNSKTGKAILGASKDPLLAGQIKALENQGLFFDVVREFDRLGNKTDSVSFNLKRKPDYSTKDGKVPGYFVKKVTNLEEAKLFIAKGISNSIDYLKDHFKYLEKIKQDSGYEEYVPNSARRSQKIAKTNNKTLFIQKAKSCRNNRF